MFRTTLYRFYRGPRHHISDEARQSFSNSEMAVDIPGVLSALRTLIIEMLDSFSNDTGPSLFGLSKTRLKLRIFGRELLTLASTDASLSEHAFEARSDEVTYPST